MAQITDLMQSYDMDTVNERFIADGVHSISPVDTPIQLMLPKMPVTAIKAEWVEQEMTAKSTTLGATCAASDATLTLAAGDATNLFPADTTYNIQIMIDKEIFLATATAGTTAKIKATPGYSSTTKAGHASGSVVHIISEGDVEGMDAKKAASPSRELAENWVQTFSKVVETTGIQDAINQLGGISSEQDHDMMLAAKAIALELEAQLLKGGLSATGSGAGSATMPRFMRGLFSWLLATIKSDSGSVDTDAIEADIQTIWDEGAIPRVIITTGKLAQAIANLYSDRIRTDVQTQLGGVNITSILNPLGEGPIAIIPHRLVTAGRYYMGDTAQLALGYVRAFQIADVESEADSEKERIQGDYTLIFKNTKSWIMRDGFS